MKSTLPRKLTAKLLDALIDYWLNVYNEVDDAELALCETVGHELLGQVWWAAFRRLEKDNEPLSLAIIRMEEFRTEIWLKDSFAEVRAQCLAIEKARAESRLLDWDVTLTLRVWDREGDGRKRAGDPPEADHQIAVKADGPKAALAVARNTVFAKLGVTHPENVCVAEIVRLHPGQTSKAARGAITQRPLTEREATSFGSDAYNTGSFGTGGCAGYMLTYCDDIGQLAYDTGKDGVGASILSIEVTPLYRRTGVARALVRRLCELHRGRITPGTIVTPHAEALIRMIKEEATRAGCTVGHYRLDPCPETDESADGAKASATTN